MLGTGIVTEQGSEEEGRRGWEYNPAAFDEAGELRAEFVTVGDLTAANCGSCHGVVHNAETPLTLDELTTADWNTLTTGQIMSPQRLNAGGLNLADKGVARPLVDIHMERVVEWCHYSLNNPVYYQETSGEKPEHLTFDRGAVDLGEYIYRPLHQFARGRAPRARWLLASTRPSAAASRATASTPRTTGCPRSVTPRRWPARPARAPSLCPGAGVHRLDGADRGQPGPSAVWRATRWGEYAD